MKVRGEEHCCLNGAYVFACFGKDSVFEKEIVPGMIYNQKGQH
jgi:hypothetical protein